ncbi:sigma 54-interacting transcriptional regulator [Alteribacillus iranensis]|uniref:Transcriptional regulator containing PAS, AAA-type ATPase, and DNA-binding Fis domains n=1 Tax=Alteribacillus iranensis TaxID=930128 RepID=A0A1I2BPM8_9BACI|nr:sigma 54-interacting transcriptional regulator [Alteribacillus iranensis]SFE57997.1 Transcriptional regulator containing PAS, AAA-type ATPase, and DNA-binding Fis domains [Alteribacillus iranensis]
MGIGVISPYAAFTESVKKSAAEWNIPIEIGEGALNRGLYNARKLIENHGVNVIVARGATATFLEEKLDIPVVKVTFTNYDLLKVFKQAKDVSSHITFIDHYDHEPMTDLSFMEDMLDITIDLKQYQDEKEITEHLNNMDTDREPVLVGTAQCVARSATKKGMKAFIVNSSDLAIADALKRAHELSDLYKKEKLHQAHLETIISNAFDGVIATNASGKVIVYNDIARDVLGIKKENILGRYIEKSTHPYVRKVWGHGETVSRGIITLGEKRYVINRIPLASFENSIVITFQEIDQLMDLNSEVRSRLHHRRFYAKHTFEDIIYTSSLMKGTVQIANEYSKSECAVLIQGESGTGKELFAQSIHNASTRRDGPFIAINCAALPSNLLESELFGYEEGSFTGAKKGGKSGLFEMAHQGTLFLDEIGELPVELQTRLLRVLQEKEVMRVGGQKIIPVDVRVISATNKNLFESIAAHEFREDLYYRLNILQVNVPPLRKRKDDIPDLITFIWKKKSDQPLQVSNSMWDKLMAYHWPGNIRELENVVERMQILASSSVLNSEDFIFNHSQQPQPQSGTAASMDDDHLQVKIGAMKEMEKDIIQQLDERFDGNKQQIANILGVSRTTLWKKLNVEHTKAN